MGSFLVSFQNTMINEGGWTDDPHETYMGVDRNYWPSWEGWIVIDIIKSDVEAFGGSIDRRLKGNPGMVSMVRRFYRSNFWIPAYDRINDQEICDWVFDKAVNMGSKTAHILLQRALGIEEDGIFGKNTLFNTNEAEPVQLREKLRMVAKAYYEAIIARRPEYARFRKSWFSRA